MDLRGKLIIFWILAVILVGAAALRLYNLEEESLWLDECFTLDYASKPINSLIETLKKDVHPIGYYLPQHLLLEYFGSSEMVLRILSVFFGVMSVFLTFILARKLFSWKEGLLAAFLMAISYTSILYSQEAKMYSMFAVFFLLSLYSFIRFLEKPSYFNVLFFSLSIILLLYTHIIGLALFFCFIMIYLFMFAINARTGFTKSFQFRSSSLSFFIPMIVFLFYLPWLDILVGFQLPLLYDFLGAKLIEKLGFNLLPFIVAGVVAAVFSYFVFLYLILKDKVKLDNWLDPIRKSFHFFSTDAVIFVSILSFIILDFLLSTYFFSSVSFIRFVFFLLPLFYILLSRILLRMKNNNLAIILFALLILSASLELYTYYTVDSKEQFREAAEYMEAHSSPADVLFLHRATIAKLCFDYYYSGDVEEVRLVTTGMDDRLLIARTLEKENAYLLLTHNYHTRDYFPSHLASLYKLESEERFIGIKIYKYAVEE